jgi:plastocyanin
MHARVPLARSTAMDRYARILFSLILVGATAACAAATDEPASSSLPVATATSIQQPAPSASAHDMGAMGSHDMGAMGSHDMGTMGGDAGETMTVDIANFAFAPAELRIAAGTTVVFTNSDSAPHTATAGTDDEPAPERFDTGLLQPGESFSVVFDEPGTYAYFCERHPPMTGVIVVEG